jgi:uncharacterized protein (TIRG00374 family)
MVTRERTRRTAWPRALGSAAVLAIVAWMVDWRQFATVVRRADASWILLVLVAMHTDRVFMAFKWRLLARGSGMPIPFGAAVKSYYVGSFWGCVLPASIGADVIRISWLARHGGEGGVVAASVVVERALGALAQAAAGLAASSVLLAASSSVIDATPLTSGLLVFATMTGIVAATVLARAPYQLVARLTARLRWARIQRLTASVAGAIEGYRRRPALLAAFMLLSVLQQALPVAANFCLARALSIDLALSWLIVGIPIALAITRAPLPFNDYGIKEGVYALIFSFAGVSLTDAVTLSMIDRVLLIVALLPGLVWTVGGPRRREVGATAAVAPPSPSVAVQK